MSKATRPRPPTMISSTAREFSTARVSAGFSRSRCARPRVYPLVLLYERCRADAPRYPLRHRPRSPPRGGLDNVLSRSPGWLGQSSFRATRPQAVRCPFSGRRLLSLRHSRAPSLIGSTSRAAYPWRGPTSVCHVLRLTLGFPLTPLNGGDREPTRYQRPSSIDPSIARQAVERLHQGASALWRRGFTLKMT
jgi:hypothetical protein